MQWKNWVRLKTFWTEQEPLGEGVSTSAPCVTLGTWWHDWASTPSCNTGVIRALKASFYGGPIRLCWGECSLHPSPCLSSASSVTLPARALSTAGSLIFPCILAQSCHLLIDALLDLYILNGSWSLTFSCHHTCISFLSCVYDSSTFHHFTCIYFVTLPASRAQPPPTRRM